jgi:site-specific DNA recombinase
MLSPASSGSVHSFTSACRAELAWMLAIPSIDSDIERYDEQMSTDTVPKRAAIYTRISQTDENIPKVERQLEMCRELAEAQAPAYNIVTVYEDDGISAYGSKNRPGWNQLMDDLRAGRFEVLIAQAEDRFTRKPMEKELLMLASQEAGVIFHTVQEGITDPATADGQLMSSLRGVLGRWFVNKGRTNLMQSNDRSRKAGEPKRGGVRPFGWTEDKLHVHPTEGPLITQAFDDFLNGVTLSAIRTRWNAGKHFPESGKAWTPQKVRQTLERESNAGIVRHRGEIIDVEAQQPALTTKEKYAEVMALLANRATGKAVEPKWLCSSLAKCPCGAKMRLATRNGSELSYRCGTAETGELTRETGIKHTSIGAEILDALVTGEIVSAVLFAPQDHVPDADTVSLRDLHKRIAELQDADQRLLDAYEAQVYTLAEVGPRRSKITAEMEQKRLQVQGIAEHNARAALLVDAQAALWSGGKVSLKDAAEVKATIRHRFENTLTLDQRRALIRSMLEITVHPGRGPKRVDVRHLVATSLNEDEISA